MAVLNYLHAAVTARLAELRRDGERGDSPVPTAVIIMGLAAIAVVVIGAAAATANEWLDDLPASNFDPTP